jgi:hypothetical protein
MCAMVALVAPRELRISRLRVTRFLESYIGVLDRSFVVALGDSQSCYRTSDAFAITCMCCVFAQVLSKGGYPQGHIGMYIETWICLFLNKKKQLSS